MTDQGKYSGTHNGTHASIWTGRRVPNRPAYVPSMQAGQPNSQKTGYSGAGEARTILGAIGVLTLAAGIICVIVSFKTTSLASAHTALVTMVCSGLLTLIGSLAVIALLAVKANK